jgi:hypothetical protein
MKYAISSWKVTIIMKITGGLLFFSTALNSGLLSSISKPAELEGGLPQSRGTTALVKNFAEETNLRLPKKHHLPFIYTQQCKTSFYCCYEALYIWPQENYHKQTKSFRHGDCK